VSPSDNQIQSIISMITDNLISTDWLMGIGEAFDWVNHWLDVSIIKEPTNEPFKKSLRNTITCAYKTSMYAICMTYICMCVMHWCLCHVGI